MRYVRHAVNSSIEKIKSRGDKQSGDQKQEGHIARRTYRVIAASMVITGLLMVISAYQAYLSRQTLIGDQRAWLAPSVAKMVLAEKPYTLRFSVFWENVGKGPALDTTVTWDRNALPKDQFVKWQQNGTLETNKTCNGVKPRVTAPVSYPSTQLGSFKEFEITASLPAFQAMNAGEDIFYVNGCLTYRTFNEIHHSAFCFFLEPHPDSKLPDWPMKKCESGNWAD
jgi:hypothetical protein